MRIPDRARLLGRQCREQVSDIDARTDSVLEAFGDENGFDVLDRDGSSLSSQMIDHAVASHGVKPGGEGTGRIVSGAPRMYRYQGFLHQIFHVVFAAQAAPIE